MARWIPQNLNSTLYSHIVGLHWLRCALVAGLSTHLTTIQPTAPMFSVFLTGQTDYSALCDWTLIRDFVSAIGQVCMTSPRLGDTRFSDVFFLILLFWFCSSPLRPDVVVPSPPRGHDKRLLAFSFEVLIQEYQELSYISCKEQHHVTHGLLSFVFMWTATIW